MCLKKYFLHFGHPKTSFSPWEISQRLGRSKGSEKGWWCQVMSVVLLSLCLQFLSLLCVLWTTDEGDVFDHNYTKRYCKAKLWRFWRWLGSCRQQQFATILFIVLHFVILDRVNLRVLKKKQKGFARYLM